MIPDNSGSQARREDSFLSELRRDGIVLRCDATLTPLSGGVSSEIFRIHDGDDVFVVKRALPKLKVQDEWKANINRNRYERAYIEYVERFMPGTVPSLRFTPAGGGYFAMEYLGPEFRNWKDMLMLGEIQVEPAAEAAAVLGRIHARSWNDKHAESMFNSTDNFFELRIDPYLLTTGKRHPDLLEAFQLEASRLASTRQCLVHGDFSPKNIMVSPQRLVLLDCEVAWYGDPAFDVAFMLTHLLLKGLHHAPRRIGLADLAERFWMRYETEIAAIADVHMIEAQVARLLPILLLARIDGKSPVEYLVDPARKDWVRQFARSRIREQEQALGSLISEWFNHLAELQVRQ